MGGGGGENGSSLRVRERNPVTQAGVLGLPLFIAQAQTHTIRFNPHTNTDAINNESTKKKKSKIQEDIIHSSVGCKSIICKAAQRENWAQ